MSDIYQDSKNLIKLYNDQGLDKRSVIDVITSYVLNDDFVDTLNDFLNEDPYRRNYMGVTYWDEFDETEEEYFGENKVLFYCGVECENYDIVTYEELYLYLDVASKFYGQNNPDKIVDMEIILKQIREKYKIVI